MLRKGDVWKCIRTEGKGSVCCGKEVKVFGEKGVEERVCVCGSV